MGAWGPKPFENDDALDWLGELLAARDASVLRAPLERAAATGEHDYLEAGDGATAIAAAAIVAALAGETGAELPEGVRDWADRAAVDVGPLFPLARDAVARVGSERSELRDLWDESDDTTWRDLVVALERRLGTA